MYVVVDGVVVCGVYCVVWVCVELLLVGCGVCVDGFWFWW